MIFFPCFLILGSVRFALDAMVSDIRALDRLEDRALFSVNMSHFLKSARNVRIEHAIA